MTKGKRMQDKRLKINRYIITLDYRHQLPEVANWSYPYGKTQNYRTIVSVRFKLQQHSYRQMLQMNRRLMHFVNQLSWFCITCYNTPRLNERNNKKRWSRCQHWNSQVPANRWFTIQTWTCIEWFSQVGKYLNWIPLQ